MNSDCISVETRQLFRLAACIMAGILMWRVSRPTLSQHDPWIWIVAIITMCVDGYLWIIKSKECNL
jgi:uncharacterized membrane protein